MNYEHTSAYKKNACKVTMDLIFIFYIIMKAHNIFQIYKFNSKNFMRFINCTLNKFDKFNNFLNIDLYGNIMLFEVIEIK